MPTENSAETVVDPQNLININIRMLILAHQEGERLPTRNKLCELQKYLENVESRLEKTRSLKYQVQEIMISNSK